MARRIDEVEVDGVGVFQKTPHGPFYLEIYDYRCKRGAGGLRQKCLGHSDKKKAVRQARELGKILSRNYRAVEWLMEDFEGFRLVGADGREFDPFAEVDALFGPLPSEGLLERRAGGPPGPPSGVLPFAAREDKTRPSKWCCVGRDGGEPCEACRQFDLLPSFLTLGHSVLRTYELRGVVTGQDLYFIQNEVGYLIKIGVSKSPKRRLGQLQVASSVPVRMVCVIKGRGVELESLLHSRFGEHRERGEWFRPPAELIAMIHEAYRRNPSLLKRCSEVIVPEWL